MHMADDDMRSLLREHMGKGFLENIIALMKEDREVVRFIPDLLGDDRIVVRLGATALVEDLARTHRALLGRAVPGLIRLLSHENPTIRGDAANALGLIGDGAAVQPLRALLEDRHAAVRDAARDALEEIGPGPS